MRPCGKALTDQSGMLDTERYKLWENIKSTMPLPENLAETELLKKARSWHQHTNPPATPNTQSERRNGTLAETSQTATRVAAQTQANPQKPLPPPHPPIQPNGPPEPRLLNASLSQRQAAGDRLLAEFNKTAKPMAISTHLCTNDDASALDRITKRLMDGRNSAETLDSLHTAQSTLRTTTTADAKLEGIAQTQGLSTIET